MRRLVAWFLGANLLFGTAFGATLEELERQVKELTQQIEQMKADREKKVQDLAQQIEQMRAERERPVAREERPLYRELLEGVKLGGYGSVRYEANNLKGEENTFTYRRFILTTDATVAKRFRVYLELELERFSELELEKNLSAPAGGLRVVQAVEGTSGSEIAVEQAWLGYNIAPWLNF